MCIHSTWDTQLPPLNLCYLIPASERALHSSRLTVIDEASSLSLATNFPSGHLWYYFCSQSFLPTLETNMVNYGQLLLFV